MPGLTLPEPLEGWLRYAVRWAAYWIAALRADRVNQSDVLLAAALAAALSGLAVRFREPRVRPVNRVAAATTEWSLFVLALGLGLAAAWPLLRLILDLFLRFFLQATTH